MSKKHPRGTSGRTTPRGPRPLPLVPVNHPILNACAYREDPHPEMDELADRLVATARHHNGLAVAAPQVGYQVALFATAGGLKILNPSLFGQGGDEEWGSEGCLSLPGRWFNVRRYRHIGVVGVEPGTGIPISVEFDDLMARCLQHEIDHLDGLLLPERWEEITTKETG